MLKKENALDLSDEQKKQTELSQSVTFTFQTLFSICVLFFGICNAIFFDCIEESNGFDTSNQISPFVHSIYDLVVEKFIITLL